MSADIKELGGNLLMIVGAAVGVTTGLGFLLFAGGSFLSAQGGKERAEQAQREIERRAREDALSRSVRANVQGGSFVHYLIFGVRRVGGIVVAKGTSVGDPNFLHIAVAHSICHPGGCEGVGAIWLNEEKIPVAEITSQTASTDALVERLKYKVFTERMVTFRHHRGAGTQDADATLTSAGVGSSSDWRRGIAYTRFTLKRVSDAEAFERAFPTGVPNLTVEFSGVRCYDPRKDSTNGGSGIHRTGDVLTWEFTRNPALCAATYQIMAQSDGGMGLPASRIIWPSVIAAANICDEIISTPVGTQPRYRCDIVLDTEQDHDTNLQKILDTMQGRRIPVGDAFKLYAGAYRAPTFSLDSSYLRGSISLQPRSDIDGLYNYVRVLHDSADPNYNTVEAPPFSDPTYEAADGNIRLVKELRLTGVTDSYQAQYIAQIVGRMSRMQRVLRLPCNFRGLDIECWETGTVDLPELSLSGATFRCIAWEWEEAGPILVLREEVSSVWALGALTVPGSDVSVEPAFQPPPTPFNLTALGAADGIHLRWTGTPPYVPAVEVLRASSSGGTYSLVGTATGTVYTDPVLDGGTWYYKVRNRSSVGLVSDDSNEVVATAKQAADADGATVINAGFESGDMGWSKDGGWIITRDAAQARSGSWYARINGTGAAALNRKIRNQRAFPIAGGDLLLLKGFMRSSAAANGQGYIQIAWLDAALSQIGSIAGNVLSPGTAWRESRISAAAPANSSYAVAEFFVGGFSSASSESWFADDAYLTVAPKNQDEIPDGLTYARVSASTMEGNEVKSMKVPDTRNDNRLPSWYRANYPRREVTEFKLRSVIGAPGVSLYVSLLTKVPWGDTSGGVIVQEVNSNDGFYVRKGAGNDASWGAWQKSYDELNKPIADDVAESTSRKWAGESGATVGAVWGGNLQNQPQALLGINEQEGLRSSTSVMGLIVTENFDDAVSFDDAHWQNFQGAGERARVAVTDSNAGGYAMRIGNNNGNDMLWLLHRRLVPFDPQVLYRIRARVRRLSGTGTIYLGVAGVAADGVTLVNRTGANSHSDQHYVVASNVSPGTSFVEYVGYVRGRAATGDNTPSTSAKTPKQLHNNVRYMRPLIIANYLDAAGEVDVDYFFIEDALAIANISFPTGEGINPYKGLDDNGDHQFHPFSAGPGLEVTADPDGTGIIFSAKSTEVAHIYTHVDRPFSSTTLADVPDAKLDLAANADYYLEAIVPYDTPASTTGALFTLAVPTGATIYGEVSYKTSATANEFRGFIGSNGGVVSPSVEAANTIRLARISAIIRVGATAGNVQLRAATEVGSSTLTVRAGAMMFLRQLRRKTPSANLTLQDPGMAASYSASETKANTATAQVTLQINGDGTWQILAGSGDTLSGTPVTGSWGTPTTVGAGPEYEVVFVTNSQSGEGSVTNGASAYMAINDVRVYSVQVSASSSAEPVTKGHQANVSVTIRKIGTTTPVSTDTVSLSVSATAT